MLQQHHRRDSPTPPELGQDKADFSVWYEAKATGRHWLTGPDIPAVVGAARKRGTS